MKGIFLYTNIDKNKNASGEAKKAEMQVNALSEWGVDIELVDVDRCKKFNKLLVRLPLVPIYSRKVISLIKRKKIEDMDYIYIRKYIFDYSFIMLLKRIKNLNKNIKVILEIPTYPYDSEWSRIIDKPLLLKEKINKKKLYKYVDKIITFSEDETIFNVPTIKINNGIDINKIKAKESKKICSSKKESPINLIGVALLANWHGYDRLIRGLYEYYKKGNTRKVDFYIVGEGSELKSLQKCVEGYNLSDNVFFCGKMFGKDLDEIYEKSHIAVGSLGMYRIGMFDGYTLKLREYCAKGIPFIKAYNDKIFDEYSFKYMINFPNDNSIIDVKKIVGFYENLLNESNDNIVNYMRNFAIDNLTWKRQIKPIADYINKC